MKEFGEFCHQIGVEHVRIIPIMYNSKHITTSYLARASKNYYENYFVACDLEIELNEEQQTMMFLKYGDNLCEYNKIYLHLSPQQSFEEW